MNRPAMRRMTETCLILLAMISQANAKGLNIYWADVEGGAATLIVTPTGESILIDTGNPGHRDPGRIAQVATRVAGIKQIDHLIITHYHGDHYGGAAMLSKLLPIKTLYDNGKFEGQPNFPAKEYYEFKAGKRVVINPGDQIPLTQHVAKDTPALSLRCLGTRKEFIEAGKDAQPNADICAQAKPKNRDGSDNANSVVMLLDFGPFRFFDAGDLTWNQEKKLACPVNLVGKVDVYQVTHHGLDSSNNPILLRSLEPTVAIMNNGITKGCTPEVFANLKATTSIQSIYQMHRNMRPDGKVNNTAAKFIANHGKECKDGHYIHLAVAEDGMSYTVNIPASKHSQRFETRR